MKYLYKIFLQYDRGQFVKKYHERNEMDTTVQFNLHIKPMKQPYEFELYYVPTNEMIQKVSEIYKVSGQLNKLYTKLPSVARNQFIIECLIEELYHTNELEGVQSTKAEIAQSIREVSINKKENRRFNSMARTYMNLFQKDLYLPANAKDMRKIYDDITEGEIKSEELPDGDTFRKDVSQVLRKSGSGKVIHRGIVPEEKIITEVEKMLDVLNNCEEVPLIIRVAIGHYFFGYIHPFYDGNGRTSRFISSLFLSESLDKLPSLSLSRGSNKFRNNYLEAFEHTNSLMSRGEMNLFIDTFLDIILKTLTEIIAELKVKIELIDIA